eukprot:CAMPEP_0114515728 /NCGR_PEP_ID=MMETSP0109-20121206/16913_1 /TAXON_ID=29199 /ORGANISM="Chlorarachnion reptans, Strain CCCM449" /LENGTH=111 /DNA_ID=CAMNT_0001695997 /DNA_START=40 /DNA_END=375 /DNA_ORIENTATION=-
MLGRFIAKRPLRTVTPLRAAARRSFYKTNEGKSVNDMIYSVFMKSNITYTTTVLGVAIFGGIAYDSMFEGLWKFNNKGKLFADCIEQKFPNPPEGTEEEEEEEDDDDDDDE